MKNGRKEQTLSEIIARRRERAITGQESRSLLVRVAFIVLAGYVLMTQVFLITQNHGQGMFPAMKDGDLTVVFRLQDDYAQDDIISYQINGVRYFGRIVADENDVVTLDEGGTLTVNGTRHDGEILYPTYAIGEDIEYPYRVPEGCVFVLGDYRTQTQDSRDFGPIPMESVEGKVITILRRRGL